MTQVQAEARETLLHYLGGDKEKLEQYLSTLSTCITAYEVAQKVIRPIYLEGKVEKAKLNRQSFYRPIVELAPMIHGKPLKLATLYYHIIQNSSKWEKEKESHEAQQKELEQDLMKEFIDIQFVIHEDKSVDTVIRIRSTRLSDGFMEILQPLINQEVVRLKQKRMKSFDARTDMLVWEIGCPALLMSDILSMLKDAGCDQIVSCESPDTEQYDLTVDETMEIVLSTLYDD